MHTDGLKTCPKCRETKSVDEFYICASRRDGHSSWCKGCCNRNRMHYKRSERKPDYRRVAKAAARGEKPSHCPDCGEETPSHLMRGRIEDEDIAWSCFKCRSKMLSVSTVRVTRARKAQEPKPASIIISSTVMKPRKYKRYCTWCCEQFSTGNKDRIFCSKTCVWIWFEAKASRLARDSASDDSVAAEAPEIWVATHEEALTEAGHTLEDAQIT